MDNKNNSNLEKKAKLNNHSQNKQANNSSNLNNNKENLSQFNTALKKALGLNKKK